MPGFLLSLSTMVQCSHGGVGECTTPNPRVKIMGEPITLQSALYTIVGCTFPPPPTGNGPCATAEWLLGATRITSEGVPVLLQDSQSLCAPTGAPLIVTLTQPRVKGM